MTIEEFYNWAIENGCENYTIISDAHLGNSLIESNLSIDNENNLIYL